MFNDMSDDRLILFENIIERGLSMGGDHAFIDSTISNIADTISVKSSYNDITIDFTGDIKEEEMDFINLNPLRVPLSDLIGE